MTQRQQVSVGGAIFNENNEMLFVHRVDTDEFMPGVWEIPGGGTEFGEKPEQALQREIMEECGIQILVKKPVCVTDYYMERNNEKVQRVEITFICQLVSESKEVALSEEHDAFVWKKLSDVKDLKMTEFMADVVDKVREIYIH